MRCILQRASFASVLINQSETRSINRGLVILAGFRAEDQEEDLEWMAKKILNLRIFDDEQSVMNKSVLDEQFDILLISQFTLFASTRKGNRPSYMAAAPAEIAIPLYQHFKELLKKSGLRVESGEFGANMQVSLTNDGPVTLLIDSKNKE